MTLGSLSSSDVANVQTVSSEALARNDCNRMGSVLYAYGLSTSSS